MSHEVGEHDKVAYYGELPWHGINCVELDGVGTSQQVIEAAGLGWTVEKMPVMTGASFEDMQNMMGAEMTVIPEHHATVRVNEDGLQIPLGVVGDRYTILKKKNAFGFFDAVVDEDAAIYHTAGSLFNGKKIWLLAKLPDSIYVGGDDVIDQYVLLSNSHDGTTSLIAKYTPIRVVCNNTLSFAIKGVGKEIKIRHTKSIKERLTEAHRVLGIVAKSTEKSTDVFKAMAEREVTTKEVDSYIKLLIATKDENDVATRTQNTRNKIIETFETGMGSGLVTAKGTLWGLYNGVTEYVSHIKTVKGLEEDGSDPMGKRMNSIIYGSGQTMRDRAFKIGEMVLEGKDITELVA